MWKDLVKGAAWKLRRARAWGADIIYIHIGGLSSLMSETFAIVSFKALHLVNVHLVHLLLLVVSCLKAM